MAPRQFCRLYKCDATKRWPIPFSTVDLVCTSPPYWQLKDYRTRNAQTGYYQTYQQYHNMLNRAWSQSYEALRNGGYLVVVASDLKTTQSPYQVIPINAHLVSNIYNIGFVYEGSIIWRKIARNGSRVNAAFPFPYNRYNREEIHIFRKGIARKAAGYDINLATQFSRGHVSTPNPKQTKHPATYPSSIPNMIIAMYAEATNVVVDPFVGTGTTGLEAKQLGCSFIGFDNSNKFLAISKSNLKCKITVVKQQDNVPNMYVFRDTHNLFDHRGDLKII